MPKLYRSGDGKLLTIEEVSKIVFNYITTDKEVEYEITIGTDSQSHTLTRIVEVIAARRIGKGGIFFYYVDNVENFHSLRDKIYEETNRSIILAKEFLDKVLSLMGDNNIDINDLNVKFLIHCDIGEYGKTNSLIKEIVSWVHAVGFECVIKPDSYTASGIANKFSK